MRFRRRMVSALKELQKKEKKYWNYTKERQSKEREKKMKKKGTSRTEFEQQMRALANCPRNCLWIVFHGKRDAGKTFGAMTYLETGLHVLVRSYFITKNKKTKNLLGNFFVIKHLNLQTWMFRMVQNLQLWNVAEWTGNRFSFAKHPLQVNFK